MCVSRATLGILGTGNMKIKIKVMRTAVGVLLLMLTAACGARVQPMGQQAFIESSSDKVNRDIWAECEGTYQTDGAYEPIRNSIPFRPSMIGGSQTKIESKPNPLQMTALARFGELYAQCSNTWLVQISEKIDPLLYSLAERNIRRTCMLLDQLREGKISIGEFNNQRVAMRKRYEELSKQH